MMILECKKLTEWNELVTTPWRISSRRTGEEPHIGKYRLLKTIGKGNFAKVKLAKHIPTGKEVLFVLQIALFACYDQFER